MSLLLAAVLALPAAAGPARRVVLVSVDTLRADALGRGLTPALDRFAASGAAFERATAAATWTLPSHASLLTSLAPAAHGGGGAAGTPSTWRPFRAPATLAGALKARGWKTKALVSSPVLDRRWGFASGFDEYGEARGAPERGEPTLAAAAAWLKSQKGPAFLFVHTNIVHGYVRLKDAAGASCPITRADHRPGLAALPVAQEPGSPLCAQARSAYDRTTRCLDAGLAALLDAAPDALVVVTSDHGETLCEPHRSAPLRGHGFPGYEEQLGVPLLLRFPGGRFAGVRVSAPVRAIDVAPTILDAAGISAPASFAGRSLLPLLEGKPTAAPPATAEGDDWSALRETGRKLIAFDDGRLELYDLEKDPGERADLSEADAEAAGRLRETLRAAAPRPGPKPVPGDPLSPSLREALRRAGYVE
jgi:arylsulfatase A-like enzyme